VYYTPPPQVIIPPVNTNPYAPAPTLYWDATCQCYR
jgi:hypothetical protein